MVKLPEMVKIKHSLPCPVLEDVPGSIKEALDGFSFFEEIKTGGKIALILGSRGVDNIAAIAKVVVAHCREKGLEPIIIPGMGSHGGATAPGQEKVLQKLGVEENAVGAPVFSSMETTYLGETPEGCPVYCDTLALKADAVFFINRIKPHTSFSGEIESGLMKMASIGIGKDKGCRAIHAYGLAEAVVPVARKILQDLPPAAGLALLENPAGKTCSLQLVRGENFEEEEKKLLQEAKNLSPKLPFKEAHLLIVDEIGKNISGTGMDTKVVGRVFRQGVADEGPNIDKIVALDLTDASGGNALGVGIADVVSRRLVDKINFIASYENALSTKFLDRVKVPATMESDREAIVLAIRAAAIDDPNCIKAARIKNTLELSYLMVSPHLLEDIKDNPNIEVLSPPEEMKFDQQGNLI